MNNEHLKKQREERKQAYYSLRSDVHSMKYKLQGIKKHRGHSSAFKLLMEALDVFDDQVSRDYNRYEKRVSSAESKSEFAALQKSLNRERAKREELEKQIQEATTSSGLFIKYVRDKLNFVKE